MIYSQFAKKCVPGVPVTDGERIGQVIRISKDKEKALVHFTDGMTEWMEYYKIELA